MPQELLAAIANAATHGIPVDQPLRGVVPSPVKGLNTRDPEAEMKPEYAIQLDNFTPEQGYVSTRKGRETYATLSVTDDVNTLFPWISGSSKKLFAIAGTNIYDVTDPDAITTSLSSGITASRWRHASANGNTILVNGTDEPLRLDSSGSWVSHGFSATGLTTTNLFQVLSFKNRLFFLEKDSQRIWYSDLNAVTGTLNKFNLGLVNSRGGNCKAIGSLSLDTGIGLDDLLAIFMENGDVLIYSGTDPSTTGGWGLAGIYHLSPVVGDKPLLSLGGDLIAITQDGYLPILQFMARGKHRRDYAFSDAISRSVNEAVAKGRGLTGWEGVLFTDHNRLFFNVPSGDSTNRRFTQHVMNVRTGAWSRYTGWDDAFSWTEFDGKLLHGGKGKVWQAESGGLDGTNPIRCQARTAYNYLKSPYDKKFKSVRHHLESTSRDNSIGVGAVIDFGTFSQTPSGAVVTSPGVKWSTVKWSTSKWSSGVYRYREWKIIGLKGGCISMSVNITARNSTVKWFSFDVHYKRISGRL